MFWKASLCSNFVEALLDCLDASSLSDLLLNLLCGDVLIVLKISLPREEASHFLRDAPVGLACWVEYVLSLLCSVLVGEDCLVDLLDYLG